MLIPTGGLVGIVAKLEDESPAAARNLVQLALFESINDQVDALRPTLEPRIVAAVEEITKSARHAMRRDVFGAAPGLAEGLSTIEKALTGPEKAEFERLRRRDARGRFMRTFRGTNEAVARQNPKLSQSSRNKEAKVEIGRLVQAGLIKDDTNIQLYMRRRDDKGKPGSPMMKDPLLTTPKEFDATVAKLPDDIELVGMDVRRGDLAHLSAKQQASLDVVGLFSGQDEVGNKRILDRLGLGGGNVPSGNQAASDWNRPSEGGPGQDRQAYRRLKLTGQALQRVGGPGSELSIAGGLAELISDLGPEAEKVLSPGIRRAAYRYRGTERRPDKVLRDTVTQALQTAAGRGSWKEGDVREVPGAAVGRRASDRTIPDQKRLDAAGDATAAYFLGLAGNEKSIPDPELAELSIQSGEIPPSQGVIIDADGDIVSQAVGYNGDHYLPFDLRNLGALNGGQYVRTRVVGGPTTEDIYTGLMTGARQLQVVSNSGVFTLEFDPNLRGGRRYSDKSRRMVQRYQQMLEAIADPGKEIYERDLDRPTMTRLRREAAEISDTQAEFKTTLARLTERERVKSSMGDEDDDEAFQEAAENRAKTRMRQEYPEAEMRQHSRQDLVRAYEDILAEELRNAGDPSVRQLKLNGAGYNRAIKALKQEFPYFIRQAEWQSLPDWVRERGMTNPGFSRVGAGDRGYVAPGQTNPQIGLQGANARRKVRTARVTAEDAAPIQEAAAATGGATAPAASTQRPGQATTPTADTRPLAERLMAPSSPFRNQVVRNSAELVVGIANVQPTGSPVQEGTDPLTYPAYSFLQHKMAQIQRTSRGNEGKTFVDWFLKASPEEKSMTLAGLSQAQEAFAYWDTGDRYDREVKPAIESFTQAMTLMDPFAPTPSSGDPLLKEPDEHDARPYKDPAVPEVGEPAEVFARARQKLEVDNHLERALTELQNEDSTTRAEIVRTVAASVAEKESAGVDSALERRELAALWTAWSFHHASEVSDQLRKIMGGGAAPLAKAAKAAPGRRVIVHKLHDPFSRRMRAELGIPEPSGV